MNFIKSVVTFGLASIMLLSCKNASSKPALGISSETNASSKKEPSVVLKSETASFKIDGMTCAIGCAKTIETKLAKMDGVQKATVDFDKKKATVVFDAAVLSPEKIIKAVESTGDGETYKVSEMKSKGKA